MTADSVAPEHFGGGQVILLDPQAPHAGFTPQQIHEANQTWIVRLLLVVVRRRKPLALVRPDTGSDGAA